MLATVLDMYGIFSPDNFNQSRCRILVFAARRANKVAKWKIGFNWLQSSSCGYDLAHVANF